MNHAQTLPPDSRRVGNNKDSQTILRPTELPMADDYYYHDYQGDYDELDSGKHNNFLIFPQSREKYKAVGIKAYYIQLVLFNLTI